MADDQQDRDDSQCVKAVLRGELAGFDVLTARYQRKATAVAYRLLNDRDDAMEVVQDAFIKAYEKLETLSRKDRFSPWLMRIVSNLALNRRRSRSLRQTVSLEMLSEDQDTGRNISWADTRTPTPEQAASAKDLKQLIEREISKLPEIQQKALLLFSVAKLPQKEVAEMLETSVQAVKWHVFKARQTLAEKLKDYL